MKYFIIAGERSGDLHGSNLIKALGNQDSQAEIKCWGGDEMQAAGAELLKHYEELAFMGFLEVVKNIRAIKSNLKLCKKQIEEFSPDVLVLIDYAGFNLRIAAFAKNLDIPVHYYIAPKVWAWYQKRALKIKRLVDHLYVILPFEKEFFARYDYHVDYVGNPLVDSMNGFVPNPNFLNEEGLNEKNIIALLPGSRKQEIENILDLILSVKDDFKNHKFVVAAVDNISDSYYQSAEDNGVKIVIGKTYDLLLNSEAAVVTSGTAALETALLNVPQIVTYKTSWFNYVIGRAIIQVSYLSLVNLVLDKPAITELIQGKLNKKELVKQLKMILPDGSSREQILIDYAKLKSDLGNEPASDKVAKLIMKYQGMA